VRRWGDQTEAGPAQGLSFRAPPKARVVAPCAGRVAFAGPFRSYGVLIILDCGEGYHFVLAGLDRLDTEAGAAVREGEPLGMMADWDPTGAAPHPALYLELRRSGQPVDPAPFLRGGS
jgi:septal ring factor EnvC (AmiA/AmiB activator)